MMGDRHHAAGEVAQSQDFSALELCAIEYGLEELRLLRVRLSPHDDVDRAMAQFVKGRCSLPPDAHRRVRAELLEHAFKSLHGAT
jgi:hypothetical protein